MGSSRTERTSQCDKEIQQISEDVQTDHAPGSPTIRSRVMTVHAISDNPPRYCIEAMAHSAADVVRNLGGLLFDRRSLGWDTLVLLDGCADVRPLRVIGADCADLESALGMPEYPRAAAIATSVDLYRSDPRVCTPVNAAIDSGSTEVGRWGDTDSVGPKPQLIAVAHQISQVAATFKTHALAAARAEPTTDIVVEKFLATRATWQPPDAAPAHSHVEASPAALHFENLVNPPEGDGDLRSTPRSG